MLPYATETVLCKTFLLQAMFLMLEGRMDSHIWTLFIIYLIFYFLIVYNITISSNYFESKYQIKDDWCNNLIHLYTNKKN